MTLVDTSVAVAAALTWHEAHDRAREQVDSGRQPLIAHVMVETFSVLTRLPGGRNIRPQDALAFLESTFTLPPIALSPALYREALRQLTAQGLSGGLVYDAIVGATARQQNLTLTTLDARAAATYAAVGCSFDLI